MPARQDLQRRTPRSPKEYTVDEAVKLHSTPAGPGGPPRTMAAYEHTLGKLKDFCKDRSIVYLGRFGQVEFWAFVNTMNHLSKKTVYDRMVIVQQLFKWCCEVAEILAKNRIRKLAEEAGVEETAVLHP